jgi:hypothetical protein
LLKFYSKDDINLSWKEQLKNSSLIDVFSNYKNKKELAIEIRAVSETLGIRKVGIETTLTDEQNNMHEKDGVIQL